MTTDDRPRLSATCPPAGFTAPDVRQLVDEELERVEFPASVRQEFRVYIAPGVHERIHAHAAEELAVEICGVLVGRFGRDENGPFVEVSESIRCDAATSKHAEVTFTHEAWAVINEQMDTKFSHLRIVGWYHSHPDFGIFLSDRDRFIHEHFYSGAGQVAFVVDPVRKIEGVFHWRDGKPAPCTHYWVGENIRSSLAEPVRSMAPQPAGATPTATGPLSSNAADRSDVPLLGATTLRLVLLLAAMVFGYLAGSTMSRWDRARIVGGVAAHYGVWKGLRPGLREALQAVDAEVADAEKTLLQLAAQLPATETPPSAGTEGDGNTDGEVAGFEQAQRRLQTARRNLSLIESTYCLTAEERRVVEHFVAAKLAELSGLRSPAPAGPPPGKQDAGGKAASNAPKEDGEPLGEKTPPREYGPALPPGD